MLKVSSLNLSIGGAHILKDVAFDIAAGQTLALVGESGSGKSLTALSILRLPPPGAKLAGRVMLDGADLLALSEREMCAIRGRDVAMVFQEPMSALNPVETIGWQIGEAFRIHRKLSREAAASEVEALLDRVGLAEDGVDPHRYPHELSGGQRQRVVIATAIALKPRLLIADEPTTALDATTQAEIIALLKRLTKESGVALFFITHNLPLAAGLADRMAVMSDGRIVETGATGEILERPSAPYTQRLMAAARRAPRRKSPVAGGAEILKVLGARKIYRRRGSETRAVDGVSLSLRAGEILGLVGESGCGKSTLARALLALEPLDEGAVLIDGADISKARGEELDRLRRRVQIVFQDPQGSFNPRHTAARILAEPLHLMRPRPSRDEKRAAAAAMLKRVGLEEADLDKYPHEFSGGERQRIAIARALMTRPALVVLDEAVSALDVSTRAQILDLLADLSESLALSLLFITHDVDVVSAFADRILVMKAGKIVDEGPAATLFETSDQSYTQALAAASPKLPEAMAEIDGQPTLPG
jgi:peptide/nickel transport system ATP-binding protein